MWRLNLTANLGHKMDIDNFVWVEKYRPKYLVDCVFPKRLEKSIKDLIANGEIPHLLLSGSAGIGKTTVAKVIANEIGADVLFINASLENGIDVLRSRIAQFASTMSLDGSKKVVILDEADGVAHTFQKALRGFMEEFSKNCRFILTCNFPKKLIEPIHSRCTVIDFNITDKKEKQEVMLGFYHRVVSILEKESVGFDKKVLAEFISKYFPDYRRILNELQRFSASGTIDVDILVNMGDKQFLELVKFLKDKNFNGMRKWVGENVSYDSEELYRKVYDTLHDHFVDTSIPQAILIIAEYQYKEAFVADSEINRVACLTEIMASCQFKG